MHCTYRKGVGRLVRRTIHNELERELPIEERENCTDHRKGILDPMT